MGLSTKASAQDEWLELSNNTDHDIDLTRFTLVSADGGLTIPLTGSIAAHGLYLIERRAEATSQPHDLVSAFEPLSDDGEQLLLMLEDGSTSRSSTRRHLLRRAAGGARGRREQESQTRLYG